MNLSDQKEGQTSTSLEFTKEEIERYLQQEDLGYQRIELPFGLSTSGEAREQVMEIALRGSLNGKSVLDVGSYLGLFCIEAIRRGADRAVGLELSWQRFHQARTLAKFLGLSPEYLRKDVEDFPLDERFDIVLCLNVLHHLHDPIGVLRYLTNLCTDRLVLECASLGRHDRRKHHVGPVSGKVLNSHPTIYIGGVAGTSQPQSHFFSKDALRHILSGHIKQFHDIEFTQSEFKDRFIVECTKLQIDRMTLVCEFGHSDGSSVWNRIHDNQYRRELGHGDFSNVAKVDCSEIWTKPLKEIFPAREVGTMSFRYDLAQIDDRKLFAYSHDPSADLLRCAKEIDVIVIAPPLELLQRQLEESEVESGDRKKVKARRRRLKLIQKSGYLLDTYQDWIAYCDSLPFSQRRYFLASNQEEHWELIECTDGQDIARRISDIYGCI